MSFVVILALAILTVVTGAIGQGNNSLAHLCAILFFPTAIALYFSPGGVALLRRHPSERGILVLNLLLGWTALGWIAALVWAYSSPTRTWAEQDGDQDEREQTKQCVYCAETIRAEAVKCRYCGSDLRAVSTEA